MTNMSEPKRKEYAYERTPIQEAVFEMRTSVDNWDVALPGRFYEQVKKKFPIKQDIQRISVLVGSPGTNSPQIQAPVMQVWNKNKTQLLQIGPGVATANYLKYVSWIEFRPAIEELVRGYLELAGPSSMTRLSTRYINRIVFDEPEIELGKYFNFGVNIPQPIRKLSGFHFTFFNQEDISNGLQQHTRTTFFAVPSENQSEPDHNAIILDIDSYFLGTMEATSTTLLTAADGLHTSVGNIFESFITDELRKKLGGREK